MTPVVAPPERSLAQRMEALKSANRIRTGRADLKRDLKAGRQQIINVLLEPPGYAETMKVFDVLIACPKYGRVKVTKILQLVRVSPSKTIDGLSDRQRKELVSMLRRGPAPVVTTYHSPGGTDPTAQHMLELAHANETRLQRSKLKSNVRWSVVDVVDVVLAPPVAAESMTIADLLMAQHRWGRTRMRRFVASVPVLETKTLGSMTDRQRNAIAAQIRGEVSDPWSSW